MTIARRIVSIGAAALLLGASVTAAQPAMGRGMGMPRYDKATETTVVGTVQEIQSQEGRAGGPGTHLILKTAEGLADVHVGPTRWLSDKKYIFAHGDQLEVIGSKVKVDGADAFIARQIKKGSETMVLRSENGIPAWSGGRRMPPPRP